MPSRLITNCDDTVLMIAATNGLVDLENLIVASAAIFEDEARRLGRWAANLSQEARPS